MKTVIALGGNAIIKKGEKETYSTLLKNINKICKELIPIIKKNNVVITHGNGPEIGLLAIQNDIAKKKVPPMPLDVLGSQTQGLIGYPLEKQLISSLKKSKIRRNVATLINKFILNKHDPAFKNPTKPIGPFYKRKIWKRGSVYKEDSGRGYRKFVPSPIPLKIVESNVIRYLLRKNMIVIAAGGGGIPVYLENNKLIGTEAVIDKDLASSVLADQINADILLIITSIDKVYLNYQKKNQKGLNKVKLKDIKKYLKEGHFAEGSMKPKIKASISFLEKGGSKVIITDQHNISRAMKGKAGTIIQK